MTYTIVPDIQADLERLNWSGENTLQNQNLTIEA